MQFRPLNDRILIERVDAEETTKGGIIIPDSAKEKPMQGKVIAVGTGKIHDNGTVRTLDIKEGQQVFFRKYAGTDIQLDGKDFLVMREDEILAVVL